VESITGRMSRRLIVTSSRGGFIRSVGKLALGSAATVTGLAGGLVAGGSTVAEAVGPCCGDTSQGCSVRSRTNCQTSSCPPNTTDNYYCLCCYCSSPTSCSAYECHDCVATSCPSDYICSYSITGNVC